MNTVPAPLVLVHGGAAASMDDIDGCHVAARAGFRMLTAGGDALAAAVAAVSVLEDDGRFNAGAGSVTGSDGVTIEMDAAVMDSAGTLGAVACIQHVRNPVRAAMEVARSPHRLLCGAGAERFAQVRGLGPAPTPTQTVLQRRRTALDAARSDRSEPGARRQREVLASWNYPTTGSHPGRRACDMAACEATLPSPACDTVGAVVRDAAGRFAVAASTGGVAPSLMGRVGDTPIIGAGCYAGPEGAVAVTGNGEDIIPLLLAHTVYRWLADGVPLALALQRGIALLPADADIGLIALTRTEAGHASNRTMPTAKVDNNE